MSERDSQHFRLLSIKKIKIGQKIKCHFPFSHVQVVPTPGVPVKVCLKAQTVRAGNTIHFQT